MISKNGFMIQTEIQTLILLKIPCTTKIVVPLNTTSSNSMSFEKRDVILPIGFESKN
jgi:hypothetical protein